MNRYSFLDLASLTHVKTREQPLAKVKNPKWFGCREIEIRQKMLPALNALLANRAYK